MDHDQWLAADQVWLIIIIREPRMKPPSMARVGQFLEWSWNSEAANQLWYMESLH